MLRGHQIVGPGGAERERSEELGWHESVGGRGHECAGWGEGEIHQERATGAAGGGVAHRGGEADEREFEEGFEHNPPRKHHEELDEKGEMDKGISRAAADHKWADRLVYRLRDGISRDRKGEEERHEIVEKGTDEVHREAHRDDPKATEPGGAGEVSGLDYDRGARARRAGKAGGDEDGQPERVYVAATVAVRIARLAGRSAGERPVLRAADEHEVAVRVRVPR
mmetsp:Transcript_16743/g.41461  ORF Transcript_16743/g.41461 Transcript_16743/m.41461 type:complete len:224 (-) Transcript_16743:332-1003(-)